GVAGRGDRDHGRRGARLDRSEEAARPGREPRGGEGDEGRARFGATASRAHRPGRRAGDGGRRHRPTGPAQGPGEGISADREQAGGAPVEAPRGAPLLTTNLRVATTHHPSEELSGSTPCFCELSAPSGGSTSRSSQESRLPVQGRRGPASSPWSRPPAPVP